MNQRFGKMLRVAGRAMCVAGIAAAAMTTAACGGSGGGTASSPLGVIDRATRTVQLNVVITDSRFNGYSSGQMTVRVPRGWKVDVYCSNQTSTPRSCAILPSAGSTTPAGAISSDPAAHVAAGEATNFSFVVRTVGSYRVASFVPRHGDGGMWENLEVVAGGNPSVSG